MLIRPVKVKVRGSECERHFSAATMEGPCMQRHGRQRWTRHVTDCRMTLAEAKCNTEPT